MTKFNKSGAASLKSNNKDIEPINFEELIPSFSEINEASLQIHDENNKLGRYLPTTFLRITLKWT